MATKKVIKKAVNNEVEMDNTNNEGEKKMVKKKIVKKEEPVDPIKEAIERRNKETEEFEKNKKKRSSNIALNDDIEIDDEDDIEEDEIDTDEDVEDEIDEDIKEEPVKKKNNEKGGKKSILKKNGKEVQSNKKPTNLGKVNTIKKDDCIDRFVSTVNSYLDSKGYDGLDRSLLEIIYNMALKVPFDMTLENLQNIIDNNNGNFDDIPKEDLKLNTPIYSSKSLKKSLKGIIVPPRIYRGNPISTKETYAPIGIKLSFNLSTAKTMEIFKETENEIIVLDESDNKITFKK